MIPNAIRGMGRSEESHQAADADPLLTPQLSRTAEAVADLIANGLANRGLAIVQPPPAEVRPLALAYEDALLAGFTPQEVKTLRRLLARLEEAALRLSGRSPGQA